MIRFLVRTAIFLGSAAIGLIATFVALLAASLFANSLTISGGAATWVLATLIVWLVTALVTLLLPIALVKAGVESARERRAA